jgi:lipopolysaccharide/colanic/teichoic acid biosynthesis glycosyltransferase
MTVSPNRSSEALADASGRQHGANRVMTSSANGSSEALTDVRAPSVDVYLTPVDARRLIDLITVRIAPAITGGLLTYSHVRELGTAVLVGVAILLATHLVDRIRYPLHLMPAARIVLALAVPMTGALGALGFAALETGTLTLGDMVVPIIGTGLITMLGSVLSDRLRSHRPVRIAVVGTAELAGSLAVELAIARIRGFEVAGWVGPHDADRGGDSGLQRLGSLADLRVVVLGQQIDLLVNAPNTYLDDDGTELSQPELLDHIARACLDLPVRMLDTNQLFEELLGHVPIGTIDAAWFRYIMHPRYRPGSPLSKRLFDLVLGSVTALISLPIVALAAVAIKLDTPGPVFYRQRRVGEHGREFEIVKLRTMTDEGTGQPLEVTRVGRILRRTHVNELPQLWNVLRGEMSLVGPRPEPVELVAALELQYPNYERRHLVKPGVTGWAQIRCGYAGSEMGSAWKLCHELYYLKHRSLLADLLLVVETAGTLPLDPHRSVRWPSQQFLIRESSGT